VVKETLLDIDAADKPTILIFNKMDRYVKNFFDELIPEEEKSNILNDLKDSWMSKTEELCVFISATEKQNIAELREKILNTIKIAYKKRYPYKTAFY